MKNLATIFSIGILIVSGCAQNIVSAQTQTLGIFKASNNFDLTPEQDGRIQDLFDEYGSGNVFILTTEARFQERYNNDKLADEVMLNNASGYFDRAKLDPNLAWEGAVLDRSEYPVLDGEFYSSSSVTTEQGIVGTVITEAGKFYVRPVGGGLHAIVSASDEALPPDHPTQDEGRLNIPEFQPPIRDTNALTDLIDSDIRILTIYTENAQAGISKLGFPSIESFDRLMFQELRDSFTNSQISARVTRVGWKSTDFASKSFSGDLVSLTAKKDGVLDDAHAWRENASADIVVLIFDNDEACGEAAGIDVGPEEAFAVVHYKCATGYFSFAHEVGHLIGARHNIEADPTPGAAHGYYIKDRSWRSVMSYNCPGRCTRFQYWSDPDRQLLTGEAMGIADQSDNTAQWIARIAIASNFFETLPTNFADAEDLNDSADISD